jgi:hypothetical protein
MRHLRWAGHVSVARRRSSEEPAQSSALGAHAERARAFIEGGPHQLPEARAVQGHDRLPGTQALRPDRARLRLHLIAGDHPAEGPLAGGLDVLGELAPAAQKRLGEVHRGAGRRHLEHPSPVGDRK